MLIKELRQKSAQELQTLLADSRHKLREFRFKVAQRQLKKVSDVKGEKKLIARILTILKEKEDKNF